MKASNRQIGALVALTEIRCAELAHKVRVVHFEPAVHRSGTRG